MGSPLGVNLNLQNTIAGGAAFLAGKTQHISGISAKGLNLTFHLTAPNATFLHIMAINFGFIVPKEEVEKYGADFGHHPVGTGAFKFGEWQLGQRLVLERNKDYHHPGVPYLDQITFEFGQEPTVALLRLKKGEVDILGDGIPPAQFLQIASAQDVDCHIRVVADIEATLCLIGREVY